MNILNAIKNNACKIESHESLLTPPGSNANPTGEQANESI